MPRAPFQVLVIPFILTQHGIEYAVFLRHDAQYWQFVAGGGEAGESPLDAAVREAREEAGIPPESRFLALDSLATVPANVFVAHKEWGAGTYAIPEHTFGVEAKDRSLRLSEEHDECRWVSYEEARDLLKWDSNRNALWELNERLEKTLK